MLKMILLASLSLFFCGAAQMYSRWQRWCSICGVITNYDYAELRHLFLWDESGLKTCRMIIAV